MKIDAYRLWERVDRLRRDIPLTDICKETGIKYTRVRDNRSANRLPSLEDAYTLAEYLKCSIDYLLTGEDRSLTAEMIFIRDNEAARLLIRKAMNDPELLEHIAALVLLSTKPAVKENLEA